MSVNEVQSTTSRGWKPVQVYAMAGICLAIGLALGYLFRGSASNTVPTSATAQASSQGAMTPSAQMPSLDDMKKMADKQAEPLLAKLQADPNNSDLLNQVGTIYKSTHQFKEAISYYQKAIAANPRNNFARTDLASCLYYEGDVDGALQQLQQSLTYNPKDANSLFNLGMIRWKGKGDSKGAVEAWKQLLKSNPQLDKRRKTEVEQLLSEAQQLKVTN
jgi:cytochrome c-type biogenesis protein CcmH/NrfG